MGDRWFASITDGEPEPEKGSGNPGWMRYLVPTNHNVEKYIQELRGQKINGYEVNEASVRRSERDGKPVKILYIELHGETGRDRIEVTSIYDLSGKLIEEEIKEGLGAPRSIWRRDGEVHYLQTDNLTNLLRARGFRVKLMGKDGEYSVTEIDKFAREFLEEAQNQRLPPEDLER